MPPARSCLDLTALWYKEVDLVGSYAYGVEQHEGEQTTSFQLALRLAQRSSSRPWSDPRFRPADYREAIAAAAPQAERATSGWSSILELSAISTQHQLILPAACRCRDHEAISPGLPARRRSRNRDSHRTNKLKAESFATEGSNPPLTNPPRHPQNILGL